MDKKLITVIIISVVTVVIWIGFEVWVRLSSDEIEVNYQNYLEYVNPEFDSETVESLVTKEDDFMMIERDALD